MRPGPVTTTTQRMHRAQCAVHWLQIDAHARRRTPDGFSRELHAERAQQLLLAEFEIWRESAFLPDWAPNDPPAAGPGAA